MTYATSAHFNNYSPPNFGWDERDPERNASLLTRFEHSGVSFGSMHKDVVGLFTALLDELVPLIPGGLVAGQCGCYNPGSVTVGGSRSFHTYAIAIDVNWGSNQMYAAGHPTGQHALPLATSNIARKYGCEWGGDWSYPKDWMHIETHLSPDVARTVKPTGPAPSPSGKHLRRAWPQFMPAGHYFGLITGPDESHGGVNEGEREAIHAIQHRLDHLGYVKAEPRDGVFGPRTEAAVARWQHDKYASTTTEPGRVYRDDWRHLFTF